MSTTRISWDFWRTQSITRKKHQAVICIIFLNFCKKKYDLTLRYPLRHSWRIGLFFSSHGRALIAIPRRWKDKSSTADFLAYFIFLIECLCNPQNAFENFRLRFYFLWCLLIFGFWLFSQVFRVIWPRVHCFARSGATGTSTL